MAHVRLEGYEENKRTETDVRIHVASYPNNLVENTKTKMLINVTDEGIIIDVMEDDDNYEDLFATLSLTHTELEEIILRRVL
jgi:hypothetical protein